MPKVLHASYSGYFPNCIETAPENKNQLIAGTLEETMELYWRVKTWRLDFVSGSVTFDYGEGVSETLTYTASQQTLGSVNAINETYLVCGIYPVVSGTANYSINSGFNQSLIFRLGEGFVKALNEIYYMPFVFDMGFVTTQQYEYQVGSVTINGLSVPLYGQIDGPPPDSITGNISASISATEYWSYGGTYNTQTGAPL